MSTPVIIRVRPLTAKERANDIRALRGTLAGVVAIFPEESGSSHDPRTMLCYGVPADDSGSNFKGGTTFGSCRKIIGRSANSRQTAAILRELEDMGYQDLVVVRAEGAAEAYANLRARKAGR